MNQHLPTVPSPRPRPQVSAKGLGDNRSILPFVILLKVGLAALCIPLVAFVFAAYQNGSLHKVDDILILGGKCYKDSKESDECMCSAVELLQLLFRQYIYSFAGTSYHPPKP